MTILPEEYFKTLFKTYIKMLEEMPEVSDICIEGDILHYLYSPLYPLNWINVKIKLPETLQ